MGEVETLLRASGGNSVERQRALAYALGQPLTELPEAGGPYWVRAGALLTTKYFQGAEAAVAEYNATEATPTVAAGAIATKASFGIPSVQDFIAEHPVAVGATAAGLAGAVGAVVYASTRRKAKGRKSSGRRPKFGTPAFRRKYGKKAKRNAKAGKARNKRGGAVRDRYKGHKVLRTKKGQPYIILASGKARFVRA